jgi:hypothetical protein
MKMMSQVYQHVTCIAWTRSSTSSWVAQEQSNDVELGLSSIAKNMCPGLGTFERMVQTHAHDSFLLHGSKRNRAVVEAIRSDGLEHDWWRSFAAIVIEDGEYAGAKDYVDMDLAQYRMLMDHAVLRRRQSLG